MAASPTLNGTPVWRNAGGDGTRRGLFAGKVELNKGKPRELPALGAVQASIVFEEKGRGFLADMSGAVQAFSPAGDLIWRAHLPGGISATPAVHPDKPLLFAATHTGTVVALDTTTGSQVWRTEIPTDADPRILSDLLYVPRSDALILSSWSGRFHALESGSGKSRASWDAGFFPYSAAAADETGFVYCLRAVDKRGVEFVRVTLDGSDAVLDRVPPDKQGPRRTLVAAAPVIDPQRGVVYFIVNRGRTSLLRAWSPRSDRLLWSLELPSAVQATPALRPDGVLLIPDMAGYIQAASPDGTLTFRAESESEYLLAGAAVDSAGTAFLGDPVGVVHAIDIAGVEKKLFEASRAIQGRPSFDPSGALYVPSTDHKVYVFPTSRA